MISFFRRYIVTSIAVSIALIWKSPIPVELVAVLSALLVDIFVTSCSRDLILYRKDLDFAEPVNLLSFGRGVLILCAANAVATLLAVVPPLLGLDSRLQPIASWAGILVCSGAASYCGLLPTTDEREPRRILYQVRTNTGEAGVLFDFFPAHPRVLASGLIRVFGAIFMSFFFFLFLFGIPTSQIDLKAAFVLFGSAFLLQCGFLILFQGLFVLRWLRRPNDIPIQVEWK